MKNFFKTEIKHAPATLGYLSIFLGPGSLENKALLAASMGALSYGRQYFVGLADPGNSRFYAGRVYNYFSMGAFVWQVANNTGYESLSHINSTVTKNLVFGPCKYDFLQRDFNAEQNDAKIAAYLISAAGNAAKTYINAMCYSQQNYVKMFVTRTVANFVQDFLTCGITKGWNKAKKDIPAIIKESVWGSAVHTASKLCAAKVQFSPTSAKHIATYFSVTLLADVIRQEGFISPVIEPIQ